MSIQLSADFSSSTAVIGSSEAPANRNQKRKADVVEERIEEPDEGLDNSGGRPRRPEPKRVRRLDESPQEANIPVTDATAHDASGQIIPGAIAVIEKGFSSAVNYMKGFSTMVSGDGGPLSNGVDDKFKGAPSESTTPLNTPPSKLRHGLPSNAFISPPPTAPRQSRPARVLQLLPSTKSPIVSSNQDAAELEAAPTPLVRDHMKNGTCWTNFFSVASCTYWAHFTQDSS